MPGGDAALPDRRHIPENGVETLARESQLPGFVGHIVPDYRADLEARYLRRGPGVGRFKGGYPDHANRLSGPERGDPRIHAGAGPDDQNL